MKAVAIGGPLAGKVYDGQFRHNQVIELRNPPEDAPFTYLSSSTIGKDTAYTIHKYIVFEWRYGGNVRYMMRPVELSIDEAIVELIRTYVEVKDDYAL